MTFAALEPEAILSARRLAADSAEHLLAEAEIASDMRERDLARAIAVFVVEYGPGEGTRTLWRNYPACCAFYTIDVGRREYDHGSLYPAIAGELGLSHQQVLSWGDGFLDFLDEVGLMRFRQGDVTKYRLESILLHGGLPDDAWQQIWREWILPSVERGCAADDADDLIELALSEGHAAPPLRKTTRDILCNRCDMVNRLVANAIRAGRAVRHSGFVDMDVDYGLPDPAIEQLQSVLDAPRVKWPELVLEPGSSDPVKVCAPAQRIPRAFRSRVDAEYDVYTTVGDGQLAAHDEVPGVLHGSSFVLEGSALSVRPEPGYDAVARFRGLSRNGEVQERRLRWRAASSLPVWVFPQRSQAGAERYACEPLGTRVQPFTRAAYLVPPDARLDVADGARVEEETALSGGWGGWRQYLVSAQTGGTVVIVDSEGREHAAWSIGRSCSIRLERDDELAIGTLIADKLPTSVYGHELPRVRILPIDLGEMLDPDAWSCRIEWGGRSARRSLDVDLRAEGSSALVANLDEVRDQLPALVTDGFIVCDGPETAGSLRRAFARVPMEKPRLSGIDGSDVLAGLGAKYSIEAATRVRIHDPETVARTRNLGNGQLEVATKLATETLTVSVGEPGAVVPMKLSLVGVVIEPDATAGAALAVKHAPVAVLERYAAGFVRLHTHPGYGAEMRLRVIAEDGADVVLRCVGREGRYTETLGLGELISALPPDSDASIAIELMVGDLEYRQTLLETLPGLGLGELDLISRRGAVIVRAASDAVAPISFNVKDLAAPWRETLTGVMEAGTREAELEPRPYELCIGKYGIWAEPFDEWGSTEEPDLRQEPAHVHVVLHDPGEGRGCSTRGPYQQGLADLLRFNAGLGPRPRLGSLRERPRLGMLPADASDTVYAAFGALHEGPDAGVELGTDIMRLDSYRYALCPPVLRALAGFAAGSSEAGRGVFAQAVVLRLPCLPVRAQNSSVFERDELERMWALDPLIGWMGSAMHSRCGDGAIAAAPAIDWLQRTGVQDPAGDLRSHLHIPRGTMLGLVESAAYSLGANASSSLSMESFAEWYRAKTTRERHEASAWVAEKLPGMREGIQRYVRSHSPIRVVASEMKSRDVGDNTKTIGNLPFVIGVLAVTSLALAWDDPNAQLLTAFCAEEGTADKTHAGITRSLLEAAALCYELLTQDMTLVRLAYEQYATGELI